MGNCRSELVTVDFVVLRELFREGRLSDDLDWFPAGAVIGKGSLGTRKVPHPLADECGVVDGAVGGHRVLYGKRDQFWTIRRRLEDYPYDYFILVYPKDLPRLYG